MAYDGWLEYNGVELVNVSRTVQLARALGIDTVRINPSKVAWIQDMLGGTDYGLVSTAPWYDAAYPASAEFAGIIPLGFPGLDDSTTEASTTEYITDGGRSSKQRNATLPIVASVLLAASTDRGAEYGKRWMDKVLRNIGAQTLCTGVDLRYFRYPQAVVTRDWVSVDVINPNGAADATEWNNPVGTSYYTTTAPAGGPTTHAMHAQVNTGFARDFGHEPIDVGTLPSYIGGSVTPQKVRAGAWIYVTGAGDDCYVNFNLVDADGLGSTVVASVLVSAGTGWQHVVSPEFWTSEAQPTVSITFTLDANTSNADAYATGLTVEKYVITNGVPIAHRRDVRLTRGSSITRKRSKSCSVLWTATFTLTCNDPFEYSDPVEVLRYLGGTPIGDVLTSGSTVLVQETCPVYDYSPIYDPLYPALVASPTAPEFYPAGWDITEGMTFERIWARVTPVQPTSLDVVPIIQLDTLTEARMVRVSIWGSGTPTSEQCGPLFSAVVAYLPPNSEFYIDGEQEACYIWDGFSAGVRRADSLVYSPDAKPVEWTSFNDPVSLFVALDLFAESGDYEGSGDVRVAVSFVSKSD